MLLLLNSSHLLLPALCPQDHPLHLHVYSCPANRITRNGFSRLQIYMCVHACSVSPVMSDYLRHHGLQPTRLLCPWDSPGKNTGVGCHALLQRSFPTQASNPHLLHCRQILTAEPLMKHTYALIYNICFSLSDSLHSV